MTIKLIIIIYFSECVLYAAEHLMTLRLFVILMVLWPTYIVLKINIYVQWQGNFSARNVPDKWY